MWFSILKNKLVQQGKETLTTNIRSVPKEDDDDHKCEELYRKAIEEIQQRVKIILELHGITFKPHGFEPDPTGRLWYSLDFDTSVFSKLKGKLVINPQYKAAKTDEDYCKLLEGVVRPEWSDNMHSEFIIILQNQVVLSDRKGVIGFQLLMEVKGAMAFGTSVAAKRNIEQLKNAISIIGVNINEIFNRYRGMR